MSEVPRVQLNDGTSIPILGLGTWQSPQGQVYQAVRDAIDAGYTHFDCAYVYRNETEVGNAFKDAIDAGIITRDKLFVTSKCWLTFYSKDRVQMCLQRTLERLQLEYLDLYLIHWPMGFKDDDENLFPETADGTIALNESVTFEDTWKGMEDVKKKGLVRSIGISNFNERQVDRVLKVAEIKPSMNQIELHPFLVQDNLVNYCKSLGIALTAYCPLGSSPVATTGHSGVEPERPSLMRNQTVVDIATKHGKSPAQVLIRFSIQRGIVCIPKSVTKERIQQNIQVFDFVLSDEDMKQLAALDTGYRFCKFNVQGLENAKDYPFK